LVVLPYCYAEADYPFLLAKWRTPIFFNASWEQLLYAGNLISKTPHGSFAINHVFHHAWSAQYAGFLKEQGIEENRIFINGQPSFMLYEEPYKHYFASRDDLATQYGLNPVCKWILFSENYNWAFYTDVKLAYFINQGQSPNDVYTMRDFCKDSFAETMRWCAQLAKTENVEIIVRPRPSTAVDEFFSAIKKILPEIPPHFHIIQDKSVREWILASDVIISSYSTSLVEAAVAGKTVYMLEPYPIPEALQVRWHELLPHLKTYDEFHESCTLKTDSDSLLGQWARKTLMAESDSIHRMANFISQLLQGSIELPPSPSWKTIVPTTRYRAYLQLRKVYRRLRYFLGIPKIEPVPPVYLKDLKDQDEITNRIRTWSNLLYASSQE